jgi:cyanophycinase
MTRLLLVLLSASALLAQPAPTLGPPNGALIIAGGGKLGPEIVNRFLELAGGASARILLVPTADEREPRPDLATNNLLTRAGATNVAVLHTRDRAVADSRAFASLVKDARGVWFDGGRQWRLVDSYLGTQTEREFHALLARNGVIGGTSAGATIQGSFLVRGAREGNTLMMAPDYLKGFGFLRNAAIDQHLLARKREKDLVAVIDAHPDLLGIGIDEGTAILVTGDRFEVLGASKVAIYEKGKPYYFLDPGARFELKSRQASGPGSGKVE